MFRTWNVTTDRENNTTNFENPPTVGKTAVHMARAAASAAFDKRPTVAFAAHSDEIHAGFSSVDFQSISRGSSADLADGEEIAIDPVLQHDPKFRKIAAAIGVRRI